jgi:hypothetical protein
LSREKLWNWIWRDFKSFNTLCNSSSS